MKAIAQRFLNFEDPAFLRRIAFFLQLSTIYFSLHPHSYRRERPIIFCSFSLSLTAINLYQTLITIYKTVTYITIRPFTLVKNIRQIRLFMQNKAKVKMGKIKPILSGVEWTNSRFCAGKKFNDDSL
jgi:hypothetical protein